MRLRVAWGGGTERQWQGTIELEHGALSEVLPLGIEADEPGSIWLEDRRVMVRQRSLRAYDGVEVLATAELSDKLIVRLWPVGAEKDKRRIEIALADLVSGVPSNALDQQGNELLVSRSPGDRLRVRFSRRSLVCSPGEVLESALEPHQLGLPAGTPLKIKVQLTAAGARTWSKEYDTTTPADGAPATAIPLEIKLPETEGVCELSISAVNASLRERLAWKKPLAERTVQLIVIGDKAVRAPTPDAQTLQQVAEIDPANPKTREWTRMGITRKEPLNSGQLTAWSHPRGLGQLVQLGAKPEEAGWDAYQLAIGNPGQPHVLEVEYPGDVPQSLGISLLEPNAAGMVMPVGLDSGVYVSDEDAERAPELLRHRIVFWPRGKTPMVLLTNRRPNSPAVYGKIRVFAVGAPAAPRRALARAENPPVILSRAMAKDPPPGGRLLAGYLDRPLMAENFSAPESLDAFSRRSLDDWNTFYLGTVRLIEYLNHVGYNGLMLTVVADGSSLYPSQHMTPTPRHDTGVFFANGQDPVRKDVLEMLFRMFDREGLALVPTVQFAAPLTELEEWRHATQESPPGLEWTGADGNSRGIRNHFRQGLGPYYNPLNRRVQKAMIGVVSELTELYASHPAFRGVGVQLAADSYAQLPGSEGSYDDETIAAFSAETNVEVPGSGPTRFQARAQFLAGPGNQRWMAWRATTLTDMYKRMGEVVAAAHPEARLYLAGVGSFDSPKIRRGLRPALPRHMRADEALAELGLLPDSLRDDPIVLMRPQRIEPLESLAAQAVDLEMSLDPDIDRLCSGEAAAALFFHEPKKLRLASFDAKNPFGPGNSYTWLASHFSPSAVHNRERFVHSLAVLDPLSMFDGGWMLPLGQEESITDLVSVYRELPGARFETLAGELQPVVVRTLVKDGQTFVYIVNDSPWTVTLKLRVDSPAGCRLDRLGIAAATFPLSRDADGALWNVTLRPYDLVGGRFSAANVTLSNPSVSVAEQAEQSLRRRIQALSARAATLANPPPMSAPANPSFEAESTDSQVAGWTLTERAGSSIALATDEPREGKQALRFSNEQKVATLRSATFPTPATGRISVSLWLRIADPKQQPTLRLALEGRSDDGVYYRPANVLGTGTSAVLNTKDWSQFILSVDDLPVEGLSDLRLRFDLNGPGEIWIDDIKMFDLAFKEKERYELIQLIGMADKKLTNRQLADCSQLLDGYWPHFLLAHVPLSQAPISVAEKPKNQTRPAGPAERSRKPGGRLEQMRDYLQKKLW
ncbi:MAG TPA: family 10 glycosylhydrolase [Pirellulales bacterium]|nr:family 10 glycosylhydrolase [Pirellulales bacterium]